MKYIRNTFSKTLYRFKLVTVPKTKKKSKTRKNIISKCAQHEKTTD